MPETGDETKRRSRLVQAKPDVFKSIPASEYAQLEREESALDEKRGKQAKELAKCLDTVRLGALARSSTQAPVGCGGRSTPPCGGNKHKNPVTHSSLL